MKKYFFVWLNLLVLPLLLNAGTVSTPDEMNSVLASVNGEAISLKDVLAISRNREFQAYAAFDSKRLEAEIKKIRRECVDEIINRKLIIADYHKQPHRIENSFIEHELDQAAFRMGCKSRSELRQKLAENNMDFDQFRKELLERMIYYYMLQKQSAIDGEPTPQEIYEYFEKHKKELSGVETYELAMLKLEKSRKDFQTAVTQATAILAAEPNRFSELVQQFTGTSDGGKIGKIEPEKMRIEFVEITKNPVENKLYGPITLDDGVVWVKLLKHNKVRNASFSEVQDKIVQILTQQRRKNITDLYVNNLRRDAILEYFF